MFFNCSLRLSAQREPSLIQSGSDQRHDPLATVTICMNGKREKKLQFLSMAFLRIVVTGIE